MSDSLRGYIIKILLYFLLLPTIGYTQNTSQDTLNVAIDDGFNFDIIAKYYYKELTGSELDSTQGVFYFGFTKTNSSIAEISPHEVSFEDSKSMKWLIIIFEQDHEKYLIGVYKDMTGISARLLFTFP